MVGLESGALVPGLRPGRLKFRVKQIVYVAFSLDGTEMGFAFPKEERAALVAAQPHRFHLPQPSDLRFNWVEADLAALDPAEARESWSTPGAWWCRRSSPAPTIRPPRRPRLEVGRGRPLLTGTMTPTDTLDDVIHLVIARSATATATVDASKDMSGTWGYPYPSSGAGFWSTGGSTSIAGGRRPTLVVRRAASLRRTLEKVGRRAAHTAT